MKKILILITILFIQHNIFASIPLERAIKNGVRLNKNYKNQLLQEKILILEKKSAKMKKFFNIHSSGYYIFKSDQMEIVLPDMSPNPGIIIPGEKIKAGAIHNYDLKVSLIQPLFTGNIISNSLKIEEVKIAIEKNKTLLSKINIATAIKTSYFNYRLLINKKKSLNALINQLNLIYKKIQEFYREELVKKSDLIETQIKIQELRMNLEDLNNLIEKEKVNFKNLCNINIEDVGEDFREKVKNYRESLSYFKLFHPVIKSLNEKITLLSIKKRIVKGEYLPHVSGFAELHYGKPGIDFFKNEWSLYFQGGIKVDFGIFLWNKSNRDKQIIDFSIIKVKNQKEDFISNGEKILNQLFIAKKSTQNKLSIVKELIQISAEGIRIKEKLAEEQQISNIDFLASLTKKERYISIKNEVQFQLELVKLSINKIIGKFQEER